VIVAAKRPPTLERAEMTGVYSRWGKTRITWNSSPSVLVGAVGAETELLGNVPAVAGKEELMGREGAALASKAEEGD
jgi:hypothetical protein